ncbi:MAG: spermidine/putrescine ABC transporter substrate-binding protein [Chthoniobacterales bacterium]|nr:spermidine/putrescine ABC transporter substrate-binding protein [Chthoniobacterales bacterium]
MKTKLPKLMAALCAGALLLAGCGKKDDTLRLFVWSEYVPQAVIDKFTEETGIKVAVENYASNEEMLAKLLAGGGSYDIIQPSDYAVQGLVKDGELQELDHAKIPNLKNLAPEFRNMPFDPGNKYSVPWMAGFVGIVYNAEVVPGPVVGYRDVFTPDHAGRIVVLDDAREIVSWGLVTEGIPINDVSSANLAKIRPLLADWLSKVKVYDSDSPRTPMLSGDTDIGVVWSGEGALLFEENPKFQWVMPAEGVHMFVDNLAIPKNSKNKDKAEEFINFILRPDISKMISDDFPYYNPNAEARKLLSEDQRNNPASYPPGFDVTKAEIFSDIGEQASEVDELITTIKAKSN